MLATRLAFVAALLTAAAPCLAAEQAIGKPVQKHGMTIGAVFLQPVHMDGHVGDHPADIHLEADIHATKGNAQGFGADDWLPHLTVRYALSKEGGTFRKAGPLLPMVASDGPHYGSNVKLDGPGKYRLRIDIAPPTADVLPRHVDKETGVGAWWQPFSVEWEFAFVGSTGKKGSY